MGYSIVFYKLVSSVLAETVAAINRAVAARTKRYLGSYATGGTCGFMHFPLGAGTTAKAAAAVLLLTGCSA